MNHEDRTVSMMLTPEEAERIEQDRIDAIYKSGKLRGVQAAIGIVLATVPIGAVKTELVGRLEELQNGLSP